MQSTFQYCVLSGGSGDEGWVIADGSVRLCGGGDLSADLR